MRVPQVLYVILTPQNSIAQLYFVVHNIIISHDHERKFDCLPYGTRSKIITLEGRRMKVCSFVESICHCIPKLSSSNALQLINRDLAPEFSTLNIQSPIRNENSTLGMKNLLQ